MNFNMFIDRARVGRFVVENGFRTHAQAGSKTNGNGVIFLILQGRQTHVKAHWAAFHEKHLWSYNRIPGDVYIKPSPTKVIPSGIELAIIHRDMVPGQTTKSGTFYTFGPPHFGVMFQSEIVVPMLPHWESVLWQRGLDDGLIHEIYDSWNTSMYTVFTDVSMWLNLMSKYHNELGYEESVSAK